MINAILTGIISLVIGLVNVVLYPIDLAIQTFLPDTSSMLSAVGSLFQVICQSLGWAVSLTGLSFEALSWIIAYFIFKLTAPMIFYMIKLAIAWYNKLKL